jgi:hypothetical protein
VQKYGKDTKASTVHAPCMLDNQGYSYTHSEYVTFIAFPRQKNCYVNVSQYYVRRALLVLFKTAILKPPFLGNMKLVDRFAGVLGIYHKPKNNFL